MTVPDVPPPTDFDPEEVLLIRALRHEPRSRTELTALTGWSRNTVAARLSRLMETGWVEEIDDARGDRGRPFARYGLDPGAALVFVTRFDNERIGSAICRLDGKVLAWSEHGLPPAPGPDGAVAELDQMLAGMLADNGIARERVRAMVVAVNGPVSEMRRTVPWSKVGVLPADLADRFSMQVAVENDANIMALGASLENRDVASLMFLLVETGIGAGLVLSGELHRGMGGWAGEVGHIPIPAAGDTPCNCGNRGCLASIASNPALMHAIATPQRPVDSVDDLRRLVLAGDTDAIMALRQAGRHIGDAITGLIIGLAPDMLAVGGNIAQVGDHVIAGIRESLAQKTPPAISSQLQIVAARDHTQTGIRGAVHLGLDLLLNGPGPS